MFDVYMLWKHTENKEYCTCSFSSMANSFTVVAVNKNTRYSVSINEALKVHSLPVSDCLRCFRMVFYMVLLGLELPGTRANPGKTRVVFCVLHVNKKMNR